MFEGPTNQQRADWAEYAVNEFGKKVSLNGEPYDPVEDMMGDLLCNMMHWCRINGHDFEQMLRVARGNFEAEVEEEAGE